MKTIVLFLLPPPKVEAECLTWGTRLTWILQKFSLLTLNWNWRKASMKGMLSISPTVPPSYKNKVIVDIKHWPFLSWFSSLTTAPRHLSLVTRHSMTWTFWARIMSLGSNWHFLKLKAYFSGQALHSPRLEIWPRKRSGERYTGNFICTKSQSKETWILDILSSL